MKKDRRKVRIGLGVSFLAVAAIIFIIAVIIRSFTEEVDLEKALLNNGYDDIESITTRFNVFRGIAKIMNIIALCDAGVGVVVLITCLGMEPDVTYTNYHGGYYQGYGYAASGQWICPVCRRLNADYVMNCACGQRKPSAKKVTYDEPQSITPEKESGSITSSKFCPMCGEAVTKAENKFCAGCGYKLK